MTLKLLFPGHESLHLRFHVMRIKIDINEWQYMLQQSTSFRLAYQHRAFRIKFMPRSFVDNPQGKLMKVRATPGIS